MLKVFGSDSAKILNHKQQFEWFDLTGKEVKIAEREKDGVIDITLEMKQDGRKTPTLLLVIATIAIAAEVAERFVEDPQLEATVAEFARNAYQQKLTMVSDSVSNAFETNKVGNLTGIKKVEVDFSQRVERDEDDNVVTTDVIAQIEGISTVYVYSPAGVFDEG